jgi:predicted nucleotidyltransferase
MNTLIHQASDDLARLCQQFRVRRLELFGSATRDDFDDAASDLDFLVEFEKMPPAEYADAYFGLLAALESLLRRPVDLVVLSAVRNPYLRESIEQSRTVLYAA